MKRILAVILMLSFLAVPVAANPIDDFLDWITGGTDIVLADNITANTTVYSLNTTLNILEWDENKIVINYTVNESACTNGCVLKVVHDDFGYPICWFDFDVSNELSGNIVTSPAESNMEIYRYGWYVTIESKGLFVDMEQNFTRVYAILPDMMPLVTNKYSVGV